MPTQREIQQQAIRSAVYGLDFKASYNLFMNENDDLVRAEDIYSAIERYFPEECKIWDFVDDIKSDIRDVKKKRWLRVAIFSHTEQKFGKAEMVANVVDIVCGWD